MPYNGIPAGKTKKMEDCVTKVMAQGHDKSSAIGICHDSIMGKEASDTPSDTNLHGPGGILSMPGQTDKKKKKKKVEDAMVETKESNGHGGYLVTDDQGEHLPTESNGKADHRLMGAAWAALHGGYRGNKYEGSGKEAAIAKLKKKYAAEGLTPPSASKEISSRFLTAKEANGQYRWTMITGSAYEDRDGEIISEKAFQDDCNYMEASGDYGELLWWHCDGSVHPERKEKEARPYIPLGSCDTSFVFNKLNIESGLYYDAAVGAAFNAKANEFGASKAFWHDPTDETIYDYIRTKERSLMPRTREANLLTRLFGHSKEKEMATNEERIASLKEKLGDDVVDELLTEAQAMSEKAAEHLKSKEAKPKAKVDEDTGDETDEPKPDSEAKPKMKGKEVDLTLAFKEQNDQLALTLKEQGDAFTKQLTELTEKQSAELGAVKDNVAQIQQAIGALLGFQPKAANKFEASKDGKVTDLTPAQKELTEKGTTGDDYLSSWIISGERPAA